MSFVVVFSLSGYDAAITVRKLTEEKMHGIEKFAESIPKLIDDFSSENNIMLCSEERKNVVKLFLGLYTSNPAKFKFKPGEIELIIEIVAFIERTLQTTDNSFAAFDANVVFNVAAVDTVKTAVGIFLDMAGIIAIIVFHRIKWLSI